MSLKVKSKLTIYNLNINCTKKDELFFENLYEEEFKRLNLLELDIFSKIGSLKKLLHSFLDQHDYTFNVQTHFDNNFKLTACKDDLGVSVQMGNIGNFAFDILKMNDAKKNNVISRGAFFIPTQDAIKKIGQTGNNATFDRVTAKSDYFSRQLSLPVCIYGVDLS